MASRIFVMAASVCLSVSDVSQENKKTRKVCDDGSQETPRVKSSLHNFVRDVVPLSLLLLNYPPPLRARSPSFLGCLEKQIFLSQRARAE